MANELGVRPRAIGTIRIDERLAVVDARPTSSTTSSRRYGRCTSAGSACRCTARDHRGRPASRGFECPKRRGWTKVAGSSRQTSTTSASDFLYIPASPAQRSPGGRNPWVEEYAEPGAAGAREQIGRGGHADGDRAVLLCPACRTPLERRGDGSWGRPSASLHPVRDVTRLPYWEQRDLERRRAGEQPGVPGQHQQAYRRRRGLQPRRSGQDARASARAASWTSAHCSPRAGRSRG